MEQIDKASINTNWVRISDEILNILSESHKDLLWRLKVDKLDICMSGIKISDETIEVLNEVKPNTLSIDELNKYFEDIKKFVSLKWTNIEINIENKREIILNVTFINSPILLLDLSLNQKVQHTFKFIKLYIHREGFSDISLLKIGREKGKTSNSLFIPFASVVRIELSKFKMTQLSAKSEFSFSKCKRFLVKFKGKLMIKVVSIHSIEIIDLSNF